MFMARTGRYVCRMTYHLHTAPLRQTALPRKGLPRRWLLMLALAMLLGATELAVRLGGAVDFPLYVVDDGIGTSVTLLPVAFSKATNCCLRNSMSLPVEPET